MGVAEAETLRRMNAHLTDFNSAIDRGTYIRTFLADERLVPRKGDPFWPAPDRIEEARSAARRAVAYIAEQGFDVIGDLDSLLVPDELAERRTPDSVTDDEVADVAVELAARMLHDVRDLRHERRDLRQELEEERHRATIPACGSRCREPLPAPASVLLRGKHAHLDSSEPSLDVRWVMASAVLPTSNVRLALPALVKDAACPASARPKVSPTSRPRSSRRSASSWRRRSSRSRTELEHADEYPTEIVEGLKELGIFGLMIPEEYGGLGESLLTYALVRRGDRPRLDERLRRRSTPTSSWPTC